MKILEMSNLEHIKAIEQFGIITIIVSHSDIMMSKRKLPHQSLGELFNIRAMDDDFNTPAALSTIFEMVKETNLILNPSLTAKPHF